jgi:predicted AAA+ superfamily ATPase
MVAVRYPRLLQPPKGSFFLLGPRGTGKSTWARERFPHAERVDLLDEALYQELLADPGQFADRLRARPAGSWVWVDEIQRLPGLLNEVHRFTEERRLRFVLTGSSARKLRRSGVNLLGGRALSKSLYPLLPEELGEDFDLGRALRHGTLPLVESAEDPAATLQAYVQTYLRQEIQAEALVRNLPGFARFLPVAALFHGQSLNVASLARDAGVARTTIEGYLEILEETLLAFRLPAWEARLRVRERRHPKLYWVDAGIVRAARRTLGEPTAEQRGALLEGTVATLLRAYDAYRGLYDDLAYWSPAETVKTEVDFLLRRGARFVAVEVKASTRADAESLRGLRAIAGLRGLERRVLVHLGRAPRRTEDGIDVLPFADFSALLASGRL